MPQAKSKYAAGTTVSAGKSIDEIKATLRRFGGNEFGLVETGEAIGIVFAIGTKEDQRRVKFLVALPSPDETRFNRTPTGHLRSYESADREYRQEINRIWRALAAGIKAKLIMVEEGIETIEAAFYAHIVLPSGATIREETKAQVAEGYRTGRMPELLPGLPVAGAIAAKQPEGDE